MYYTKRNYIRAFGYLDTPGTLTLSGNGICVSESLPSSYLPKFSVCISIYDAAATLFEISWFLAQLVPPLPGEDTSLGVV